MKGGVKIVKRDLNLKIGLALGLGFVAFFLYIILLGLVLVINILGTGNNFSDAFEEVKTFNTILKAFTIVLWIFLFIGID